MYVRPSKVSPTAHPDQWTHMTLSSCDALEKFTTSVQFRTIGKDGQPTAIQQNISIFRSMLDLLSELPRGIKVITIVLKLNESFHQDVLAFGSHLDWARLETITNSLPQLETVNIILFLERLEGNEVRRRHKDDTPEGIPDACEIFIASLLGSKRGKGKSIVTVTRELGDYPQFIHTL